MYDDSASKDAVLIVGCRRPLLEAARRRELAATVVYGPVEKRWIGPDLALAHRAIFVDRPHDVECVLAALVRAGLPEKPYRGVCAASEDFVTLAAVLGELLDSPNHLPVETAIACRDKAVQKARIWAAGISVAASRVIPDLGELRDHETLPNVRFPAVLKPVGGVGVTETTVVADAAQLVAAARRHGGTGTSTFLLEEYVDGDEWEMDGVIHGGRLAFLSVGRYGDPLIRIQDGKIVRSIVLDPDQDADAYARARPFVQAAVTALGIVDGVIHLEAFRRPDRDDFVFGECAVRPGGGWICELVQAKFGIDLHAAHLDASCGLLEAPVPRSRPGYFGMALLPMVAGILESCPGEHEIATRPDVVLADLRVAPGRVMQSGTTTVNARMGGIVVRGRSVDDVEATIANTVTWFMDRVVVRAEH